MSEATIEQWFGARFDQLDALDQQPERHPIDEIQTLAIGQPSHRLMFGDHLVFFIVSHADACVEIDRFVHGARDRSRDRVDLDRPSDD